ncbi:PIN domain-containing protein [Variovorax paradoxus]|uniref:PIN domain-containing protein n=1 Tax=Variovorax paradoxus TaxID=34073 RepID=UPI001560F9FE|nr:PIN domain-containing protein [Variovorax paradoxus]
MSKISKRTFIVLDTNLLLHFKQPDQMDWTAVSDEVVLLILPVVLRELEKAKAFGGNLRVKQRAGKMVSWLSRLLDDGQEVLIRSGVALHFVGDEPQVDFAMNHLAREVQDDQIVASLIDLKSRLPSAPILCTADIGLRVKAKQRGFQLHVPLDSDRLAEEPDPKDKEISELRQELQQLKVKVPKLSATFVNGNLHVTPDPVLVPPTPSSLERMKLLHQPMTAVKQNSSGSIGDIVRMFSVPSEAGVEHYNKRLHEFFNDYEKYLEKFETWSRTVRQFLLFDLKLTNSGTTPATHVDAIFTFPEGVQILRASKMPEAPRSPVAPERPKHALSPMGSVEFMTPLSRGSAMPAKDIQPWTMSCEANRVHLKLERLKHGFDFSTPKLAILFSDKGNHSISFQAELTANELASRIECELHLVAS